MSLVYLESFFAFAAASVSDAYDIPGNTARDNTRLALARGGYGVSVAANTSQATTGGFIIRPDPVYPERHALCHSSDVPAGTALQYSAAIRKRIPLTDKQIIIGMSLYIPPEYVANTNSSTVAVFRVNATTTADANWFQQGIAAANPKECFRVCNDLSLRWGTDATQSSKKLTVGTVNYLEMRIDPGAVSIWIDDVFVMQKVISLVPETIAFCFENNLNAGAGGTQLIGNAGRWALGNMYYVFNDGQAPTVRLGPSTRVIAQRPDTDVDVRFIRPAAAPTNAAVAAQDLVDSPPWQLQSTNIGDFDTYASQDATSKAAINAMAMVHAVATKTLASNLEPDPHKVRPYVKSHLGGAEGADNRPRELVLLSSPTTRTIRAMAVDPVTAAVVICGDGEMCYRSGPNYDLSTWTRISDTGSAKNFRGLWMRADGGFLISAEQPSVNVGVLWVAPGTSTAVAGTTFAAPGGFDMVMAPDGSLLSIPYNDTLGTASATGRSTIPIAALNGAAPQNAVSALAYTAAGGAVVPSAGGWSRAVSNGPVTVMLPGTANDRVYVFSTSAGSIYSSPLTGDTGIAYRAVTWDGTAWIIGATTSGNANSAPQIRRSTDAQSWSQVTQIGNTLPGANAILRFGISNRANQQSLFGGDSGAMMITADGINFRQLPRLTANALYAGLVMASGDFLVGGANGTMLRFQAQGADTTLVPLAGYTMAFGSAVINPKTGSVWTPAEAADADFGVRLSS